MISLYTLTLTPVGYTAKSHNDAAWLLLISSLQGSAQYHGYAHDREHYRSHDGSHDPLSETRLPASGKDGHLYHAYSLADLESEQQDE